MSRDHLHHVDGSSRGMDDGECIDAAVLDYITTRGGLSSYTIAHVLGSPLVSAAARVKAGSFGVGRYPLDPSDFLRCIRLLDAVENAGGDWRSRLPEVAAAYPGVWARMIDRWGEWESLYRQESPSGLCPRLYSAMQEARDD